MAEPGLNSASLSVLDPRSRVPASRTPTRLYLWDESASASRCRCPSGDALPGRPVICWESHLEHSHRVPRFRQLLANREGRTSRRYPLARPVHRDASPLRRSREKRVRGGLHPLPSASIQSLSPIGPLPVAMEKQKTGRRQALKLAPRNAPSFELPDRVRQDSIRWRNRGTLSKTNRRQACLTQPNSQTLSFLQRSAGGRWSTQDLR